MTRERLYLFDTTLRDGAQTTGVDFSLADKRKIAEMLDKLGVDYIEGGYPGANPVDTKFFEKPPVTRATFTAFGMTKRAGVSASNDPGLQALVQAGGWDAPCRKISRAFARASRPRLLRARKPWSIASISSMASRPTAPMRWIA
jgi:2-isopropylmalate synthase